MKCDEIFAALDLLEKERGIPRNFMMGKIIQALITAYKRDHEGVENVIVDVDEEKRDLKMYVQKEVVEEVENLPDLPRRRARDFRALRGRQRGELPREERGVRPHRRRQRQAGHHPGLARGGARHDL